MAKHSEHWKLLFPLLGFLSSHIKTNEETLGGVFSLLLYIFMIIFVSIPLSNFSTIPSISKLKILSYVESIMQTATSPKEVLQQSRLLETLRYEKPLLQRGWPRQCVCYFHSEKCLFKLRGGSIHKKVPGNSFKSTRLLWSVSSEITGVVRLMPSFYHYSSECFLQINHCNLFIYI